MLSFDNPFWKFSLAVYGAPEIAAECLNLQRRLEIDVNVLLFCAFMGSAQKVALNDKNLAAIKASVAAWHQKVVRPLRAARQAMKPLPQMSDDAVQALRQEIATIELRAEQAEQAMLFELIPALTAAAVSATAAHAVEHNIDALLRSHGADAEAAGAQRLITAASNYRPE
ncbi:MAG TPA: TIGR02444 family protein [Pseudolabrys sp.]|nr:TIGR02444 family protein [Pseudolabrys sp.]